MRPATTLVALTLAAGFGGFAATACQAALDSPAQAEPIAATPAIGASIRSECAASAIASP